MHANLRNFLTAIGSFGGVVFHKIIASENVFCFVLVNPGNSSMVSISADGNHVGFAGGFWLTVIHDDSTVYEIKSCQNLVN